MIDHLQGQVKKQHVQIMSIWKTSNKRMDPENKVTELKETRKERRIRFNYRWIVRNVPFFLFLSGLAVVYIYNGHNADKTIRNINKVSKELKELQYEYKTLKGEVIFRSKQSELVKAMEPYGLKELVSPPVLLTDSSGNEH
jgi:hypothetical protein